MKLRKLITPLLFAGLLLLACLPEPQPDSKAGSTEKLTAAELAEELAARSTEVESLRADLNIAARMGDDVLPTSEHSAIFSQPDRVYLESYGPLGEVLAITRVVEGKLAVYFPADGVWLTGDATAENAEQLLGVNFEIGLLTQAVLGAPLVNPAGFDGTIRYLRPEKVEDPTRLAFRLSTGEKALLLTVEDERRLLLEQVFYCSDAPALRVSYAEYTEVDGFWLPGQVSLTDDAGIEVEINLTEQAMNLPLPEGVFSFTPPDGVRVIELDELE